MRNLRTTVCTITTMMLSLVAPSLAAGSSAPQAPSAKELLEKYTQALDATDSYVDSYETVGEFNFNLPQVRPMQDARRFTRGEHRADGRRAYHRSYFWGDINTRERNLPESSPRYHLRVEADRKLYVHPDAVNNPRVQGRADFQTSPDEKAVISREPYSGILGFLGADERLDAILRRAGKVSVRPATETVNGSACHVIDAQTAYGKYTVWLDPQHGYQAARVTREATGGHKTYISVLPRDAHETARVEVVRFEQVDGVWVPMEGSQDNAYTAEDPQYFNKERTQFKRTRIALNPDHEKLGSFDNPLVNPARDPQLKNGTMVRIGPVPIKGVWQDGKIVDSSGKAIDIGLLKTVGEVSIRGKPLPALTGLCAELFGVPTEGKPVLVCFVDLQQRPSRQCLATLSGKADALAAKEIVVVVVQTAPLDAQQQDALVKSTRIAFPIHRMEGDLDARKSVWGVKSLPWLILTDAQHVVRAEGFAVSELDSRIQGEKDHAKP